ncbi:hypothetical protein CBR_g40063 [Chara braunii]|uniref:BTB domain-containing protein n=1 Tax=Chara braunii TaxID=69332 RepID=A0A388LT31_CHABU|nr:hypothetical protein CBR_g40063 [Chara braunii]|eukprot:GBG85421.1 hypothetical protein CBR_g40063 [Chara braunii]
MGDTLASPCPFMSRLEEEEEDAKHRQEFASAARTILDRPELLDVTFVCERSRKVKANRALLASGSEYFSKLLYGDMKERSMDTIPLPTVKAGSLQAVVGYLHGRFFRWESNSCWADMVDIYCLAEQYQVDSLCQRILLFVSRLGYAHEIGDLLNAAVVRHAEEILKIAVSVMNNVLVFNSSSFLGWRKESIKYCLDFVRFHPNVTETLIAEAVLAAASSNVDVIANKEKCEHILSDEELMALKSLTESISLKFGEVSGNPACSGVDSGGPTSSCSPSSSSLPSTPSSPLSSLLSLPSTEQGCLSKEDLEEIFTGHISLPLLEPGFMREKVEPLGILRQEILTAIYRVHSVCFSRGISPSCFFTIPWRSLKQRVSFAPVETDRGEISDAYRKVALPSLWIGAPNAGLVTSEELPQRVSCSDHHQIAVMQLPLISGKHVWRIRIVKKCASFAVGVSSIDNTHLTMTIPNAHWMLSSSCWSYVTAPWELSRMFVRAAGIDLFDKTGASIIVVLDMKKRTLTFANDLESYTSYGGEYPVAFYGLPCDAGLYPALLMSCSGCAEIEWIESSPRDPFVR